eukprot:GHVS01079366.1.p1 GENE.GHVS01079366.1~~GHVS01079366.1.p1  ORF type:complete len:234 (+),score=31.29 GHVS01079366.1:229-930(+)
MTIPILLLLLSFSLSGAKSPPFTLAALPSPTPPKMVSPVTIVYQLSPACLDQQKEVPRRAIEAVARELVSGAWVEVKIAEEQLGSIEERLVISVRYRMPVDGKQEEAVATVWDEMFEYVQQARKGDNEVAVDATLWNIEGETVVDPSSQEESFGRSHTLSENSKSREARDEVSESVVECQAFVTWMLHVNVGTLTSNCGDPERWVMLAFRAMEQDKCVSGVFLDSAAIPATGY